MGLTEKTFRDGEIIIKEGDNGTSFFRLLEGNAGVYAGFGKNDQIKLAVLNAGEYFGEMAILEAYPRSATVVAKGSARLIFDVRLFAGQSVVPSCTCRSPRRR